MKHDTDAIKAQVSILSVVSPHVKLRKVGAEYTGKCPFHQDDTPSFTVNPDKGVYFCHGCGAKGDIFSFVQQIEGVSFTDAVDQLASGLPEPPPAEPRVVATYNYTDESDSILYQVQRWEPGRNGKRKSFTQRCPDGHGGWVNRLGDVRRVLFRLPRVLTANTVYLVEGEKDALALELRGFVATTMSGGSESSKHWLPDYTTALSGKTVYIVPDNDAPGIAHANRCYAALRGQANVTIINLPHGVKDVSDFFAAGRTDLDFRALTEPIAAVAEEADALPPVEDEPDQEIGDDGKTHPNVIARQILKSHAIIRDMNGYMYEYNGRFWEKITTKQLTAYAIRHDKQHHTSMRRRNETASFIQDFCHVKEIRWRQIGHTEVPFSNGVYDITADRLRPHRREDYLETCIPHPFTPADECHTWLDALTLYFGQDESCSAKISAIQEFFGYCLLPHARFKKALLLTGEGDTGKSQLPYVLREALGLHNCCAVSVEAMDDSRKRVPLIGKMLNVLTELTSKSVIADGGFKTLISTEEPLEFDPKYEQPIMYAPFAKHVIACNELPAINDRSKATYNRLLLVQFNHVIPPEKRDRHIMDKLRSEIPGILNWAVAGAQRLIANGGEFTVIDESVEQVREYRESQNDIYGFIEERCVTDPSGIIPMSEFYDKFSNWVHNPRITRNICTKMLKAAGFDAGRKHRFDPTSNGTARAVFGLIWKPGY